MRTGGQLIIDTLEANGVERLYCVPGESYLAVLDALHDSSIRTIICRQEGGAAMMADCEGRLTGRPGICFVTRGPGATNASPGVHIARQDSVPMLLFIGQVASDAKEREAFQEVDYRAFFGSIAKWVVEIDDAARIPELVGRAYSVAMAGRPGPVVISLPEDMLTQVVEAPKPQPVTPVEIWPGEAEMKKLEELLSGAKKPFVILGGTRWSEEASLAFQRSAESWALPVGVSFRRQMLFDHLHPCFAGDVGIGPNPKLAAAIKEADVLLLIGGRMSEIPSSDYSLIKAPYPDQTLVHVHPDAAELGRVYRPALAINASPHAFATAFAGRGPKAPPAWKDRTAELHASYMAWSTPPATGPGDVHMGPIMEYLDRTLPDDTIFCNGAGNFATWAQRFRRFRRYATQAAPTSGSMGYGPPAGVGAQLVFPDRQVVVFAGDGDFLMNGQEFATAVRYGLPIIVVVINNGIYGTIRMHQERHYPGRVSGTDLTNPDFAALARSYGGHGETVLKTADFAPAFERARESGLPSIIEVRLDPEAITPARTLSDIREGR